MKSRASGSPSSSRPSAPRASPTNWIRVPYWSLQKLGRGWARRLEAEHPVRGRDALGDRRLPVDAAGDVARRVHAGQRGRAGGVDRHARLGEPARPQPARRRPHADAGEQRIALQLGAVVELNGVEPGAASAEALDPRAEPDVDPLLAVQVREPGAQLGPERSVQRRRRGLDHRHLDAERARRRGDLLADEAGAGDREPRAGPQALAQPGRVGGGAQQVDVLERLGARERDGPGAGREQDAVVGDRLAAREPDRARARGRAPRRRRPARARRRARRTSRAGAARARRRPSRPPGAPSRAAGGRTGARPRRRSG